MVKQRGDRFRTKESNIIIFDFDGTIADSYEYVLDFLRRKAGRKEAVSDREEVSLRGYPMHQMARKLGMPWWRMPFLFFEGRREMASLITSVELFPGMDTVIRTLFERGHKLYIISSNSEENIRDFLKQHNLEQYFTDIDGKAGLTNKSRFIRKVIEAHGLAGKPIWYIGDEVRDVRAAQRANVHSVAVTWGYNNIHVLDRRKPDFLALHPDVLLEIFE